MVKDVAFLVRRLYRPELYQGPLTRQKTGYFEGWYFKCAFPHTTFAVIPGISNTDGDSHAFIQTLRGRDSAYHRFPVGDFSSGRKELRLLIGDNRFSLRQLKLRLPGLAADLRIRDTVRWPSSLPAPSSMGWYAYMRFMECYHGIILVDGKVSGTLNGERVAGGRFYLEKDWGTSFPRGWIWMQSNSFGGEASFTCSIARVPFRTRVFSGFIVGLWDGRTLHRFATYTGAQVRELSIGEHRIHLVIADGTKTLTVDAERASGAELASPVRGAMEGRITESLDARIEVRLVSGRKEIFAGTGDKAGLEVVNPDQLGSSTHETGTHEAEGGKYG